MLTLRQYEGWAWAAGIVLIWADVVLPVPQTAVIAALGIIYGTLLGGLLGTIGLITGGLLGYGLMLTSARRLAHRFAGSRSLLKMESLFDRRGAWAIVLTRSLPYSVPEAMVFLAGLAGMPMKKFTAALTVGSVPTALVFAAIGAGWADQPIVALGVSYLMPILLLPVALYLMHRRRPATRAPPGSPGNRIPVIANLAAFALFLVSFSSSSTSRATWRFSWRRPDALLPWPARPRFQVPDRAGSAWSLVPMANDATGIVTTGPYRLVRHPIYLGLAMLAMGAALAFASWPAAWSCLPESFQRSCGAPWQRRSS